MRRILSYILFSIVLFQIVGASVVFEVSRYSVKKEVKARIENSLSQKDLIVIKFSHQNFKSLNWLNKNEFEINGELFDVVRLTELPHGWLEVQCINDVKEKELFRQLGRETANKLGNEDHPTPLFNWVKLLHSPTLLAEINYDLPIIYFDLKVNITANYQSMFSDAELNIESPPPCIFG